MSDTVKFRYSSFKDINFRGEVDSGIPREEWEDYSYKEKGEAYVEMLHELVELVEVKP
ncbi:hypothetical protein [Prauserella endophytica]|uniref:hypothetical protein n=1 Tax=Prauserella endophytica TaxID=1592324 RepID=UPI0013053208|nr:hypothetical protein [Prauserella endophytica]